MPSGIALCVQGAANSVFLCTIFARRVMENGAKPTTVFIADDHPIYRDGLVQAIQREAGFAVCGEAGDGDEALRRIREQLPRIALLDIEMPGMSGLDVVRELRAHETAVACVILTIYDDEAYFNAAMDLGVRGYVLKDSAASELASCLRTVASGKLYVTPSLSEHFVSRINELNSLVDSHPGLRKLTPAERRVLRLIALNRTSREIADELFLSVRTVQNHRTRMCLKLELQGYNKLLHFALEHRHLLSPDSNRN